MSDEKKAEEQEVSGHPATLRDRPYDGQPHTDHGIRGATDIDALEAEVQRIRDGIDYALHSGDGVPQRSWLAQQYRALESAEEAVQEAHITKGGT